ncbi:MAG: TRAP transporter substrate-binding protein [Betaproteobacteria bacterium]|nr:TRAP transporter substrate-binding protein [Betaproteobacteria bacterium]
MKMMSKAAFVAAALVAAGAVLAPGASAQQVQPLLIGNATANDAQAAANDKLAELLTKYSKGRFTASARHGSALGTNAQMIAALQAGAIHGMITPAGFTASVVPENSMWDMPFLLPGKPALITAFAAQSKAAKVMKEAAAKKGIHVLAFHGAGALNFLARFPITKLGDIQGKKFRVIPSPPRVGAYQDWGVVARPMEFGEVYTALQQGALDGQENPPDVLYKMKMYEVAKYYTITEHSAFVSIIMVSKKWYDGLPKDLQDVVERAGRETVAFADPSYTKSQNDSLEAMRKAITVTDMPKAEIQRMKDLALKGVWERMKADPQRGPIVKLLFEDLANFNKNK